MSTSLKVLAGFASFLLASGPALAKTALLIPIVPFPGATSTAVFGIADDNNTIAGSYIDSGGATHGFYGTVDGNYTSFDYGESTFTQARGITIVQGQKIITGFSNNDGVHCDFEEWEKFGDSPANGIGKGAKFLAGIAQGISIRREFAGDYCDTHGSGTIYGLLGKENKWKQTITTPFESVYTGERGINRDRDLVGFYQDNDTGLQVGTAIVGGIAHAISYPDANETYTVMEGVNDRRIMTGQWQDTGGIVHSFSLDFDASTYVEIDDPNAASFTQAWGINKVGMIAVTSDAGAYIYCTLRKSKCPNTGLAAITVPVHEVHAAPGHTLRYGAGRKGQARLKLTLPKGAAVQ